MSTTFLSTSVNSRVITLPPSIGTPVIIGILLIALVVVLTYGVTLSIIADKAGVKNGWRAWIPVLNLFLEFEIAGLKASYVFLYLVLFLIVDAINLKEAVLIAYVLNIYIWMRISERLGKNPWLGLLYIFPIFGFFLQIYLACVKAVAPKTTIKTSEAEVRHKIDSYPVDMGIFNFIKNGISSGKSKEEIFASLTNVTIPSAQLEAAYTQAEKELSTKIN